MRFSASLRSAAVTPFGARGAGAASARASEGVGSHACTMAPPAAPATNITLAAAASAQPGTCRHHGVTGTATNGRQIVLCGGTRHDCRS